MILIVKSYLESENTEPEPMQNALKAYLMHLLAFCFNLVLTLWVIALSVSVHVSLRFEL